PGRRLRHGPALVGRLQDAVRGHVYGLIVRFGPLSTSLPLDRIVEVFPTHNPLSAPAPSLDRLRINYQRKNGRMWFALISPKDKEAFVRDLASAAPHLRSAGGEPLQLKAEAPA